MTLHWRYESRIGLDILAVSGHLGASSAPRFAGAVGWSVARGAGPLIVDLSRLQSWDAAGQGAIVAAACRLAGQHRALELAAVPAGGAPVITTSARVLIPIYPDLATALRAHGRSMRDPGEHQVRQTTGWPETLPQGV